MILRIQGYDMEIPIEGESTTLCILNKPLYRKIIMDIHNLIQGGDDNEIVIEEARKMLNYDKEVLCITDYFNLGLNNRHILTLLNKKVKELIVLNPDYAVNLETSYKKLIHNLQSILLDCEVEVTCNTEFDVEDFLKFADLKFSLRDSPNLLNRLYTYLDIYSYLQSFKLLIFVNLRGYFSSEEIQDLYKYMKYKKIRWICIEGMEYDTFDLDKKYLIDEDLVEFPYLK